MSSEVRILIIEDNEYIRHAMEMYFSEAAYTTESVFSGEDALKKTETDHFDVVIVDYILPGMDGLEFLEKLNEEQQQALIVLISGHLTDKAVSRAFKLGADMVESKPIALETIEHRIESLKKIG